jgi:hypothetical protein
VRAFVALGLLLAACDGEGPSPGPAGDDAAEPTPDASASPDAAALEEDLDGDGIPDAREAELAAAYLPFLSLHPDDGCTVGGLLYRMRPHPEDASRIHIVYVHLFQTDCGLTSHVGDDEAFGVTIDPAVPPPEGILAIRTISHQNTPCEQTNDCGAACGLDGCEIQAGRPVVFSSRDKHGGYLSRTRCNFTTCLDQCQMNSVGVERALVNAGEPEAPLVRDLTAEGFIQAANGWTETSLHGYDPWSGQDFGSAGNVADDLVDPAFLTPVCP